MTQKIVIENLLIIIGESFWIISAAAQLMHLIKTRKRQGLSAINQSLNGAGNVAWMTYFASRHLWFPFTTNFILFFLTLAILGHILTNKRLFYKGITTILVIGAITSFILIGYPIVSGWLGVTYNSLSAVPWLKRVIKIKRTSGISYHSLLADYVAMSCTLAYAILIISFPLMTGCILGLVSTTVIANYYFRYRHL
jgi:uncharacterized protein with PQ loop repeat